MVGVYLHGIQILGLPIPIGPWTYKGKKAEKIIVEIDLTVKSVSIDLLASFEVLIEFFIRSASSIPGSFAYSIAFSI